jgi:hypothetical protein
LPAPSSFARPGPRQHEDRAAGDEPPKRAADAVEADARGRDEESRQRRLALGGVGEGVVQRAAEGRRAYHMSGPLALARDPTMRALGAERLLRRYDWLYGA